MAITAHLTSNFYPPLPADYVQVALAALEIANRANYGYGDWDNEILEETVTWPHMLTVGMEPRGADHDETGHPVTTAMEAMEMMQLWAFVTEPDEEEDEDDE